MLQIAVRTRVAVLGAFALLLAAGTAVPKPSSQLTVHEWGTFLAMNGSDGVTLDGMYHEEHALPAFVHSRSKDELRVPSVSVKGETPVIYFYTDRPQDLTVHVRFPQGLWTQWYPQAEFNGPTTAQAGSPPALRNGHITWSVHVAPAKPADALVLPKTETDSLWNYARDVDAAIVRPDDRSVTTRGEAERFIFYRGLGEAKLPLRMETTRENVLTFDPGQALPLRHLFVIRVEHGRGAYRYVPAMQPGERVTGAVPSMAGGLPQAEFSSLIGDDLARRLTEIGLYPKEARAMVNTWRRSYFETDGIRVLFVLPQPWTDAFIPMEINPRPSKIVRVMVGRLEVLTPEREQAAAEAVRRLGAADERTRDESFAFLRKQGRYLEPILRRTLKSSDNAKVRDTCRTLLLTDFVTELRSAVANRGVGSEGTRDAELDSRAQLASLLREVGLTNQGKEEARGILPAVQQMQAPKLNSPQFRPYARIHARTMEALGEDASAADWYGRFVKFGSQTATCQGCHETQGPRDMTFYRDWWAGRKAAVYAARTEGVEGAIARQSAAVRANPRDTAARMMLAYLYELKGEKGRADGLWARITASAGRQVSSAGH